MFFNASLERSVPPEAPDAGAGKAAGVLREAGLRGEIRTDGWIWGLGDWRIASRLVVVNAGNAGPRSS
jgi:hypothetical protein